MGGLIAKSDLFKITLGSTKDFEKVNLIPQRSRCLLFILNDPHFGTIGSASLVTDKKIINISDHDS